MTVSLQQQNSAASCLGRKPELMPDSPPARISVGQTGTRPHKNIVGVGEPPSDAFGVLAVTPPRSGRATMLTVGQFGGRKPTPWRQQAQPLGGCAETPSPSQGSRRSERCGGALEFRLTLVPRRKLRQPVVYCRQ